MKRTGSWLSKKKADLTQETHVSEEPSRPSFSRRLSSLVTGLKSSSEKPIFPTYDELMRHTKAQAEENFDRKYVTSQSSQGPVRVDWIQEETSRLIKREISAALLTLDNNSSKLTPKVSTGASDGWKHYVEKGYLYPAYTEFRVPSLLKHPPEETFVEWAKSSDPSVSSAARLIQGWQFPIDIGRVDRIVEGAKARAQEQAVQRAIVPTIAIHGSESDDSSSPQHRGRKRRPRSLHDESGPSSGSMANDNGPALNTLDNETLLTSQLEDLIASTRDPTVHSRASKILNAFKSGDITVQAGTNQFDELRGASLLRRSVE